MTRILPDRTVESFLSHLNQCIQKSDCLQNVWGMPPKQVLTHFGWDIKKKKASTLGTVSTQLLPLMSTTVNFSVITNTLHRLWTDNWHKIQFHSPIVFLKEYQNSLISAENRENIIPNILENDLEIDRSDNNRGHCVWIFWLHYATPHIQCVDRSIQPLIWEVFNSFIVCLNRVGLADLSIKARSVHLLQRTLAMTEQEAAILQLCLDAVFFLLSKPNAHKQFDTAHQILQWLRQWICFRVSENKHSAMQKSKQKITELFSTAAMLHFCPNLHWNSGIIILRLLITRYVLSVEDYWKRDGRCKLAMYPCTSSLPSSSSPPFNTEQKRKQNRRHDYARKFNRWSLIDSDLREKANSFVPFDCQLVSSVQPPPPSTPFVLAVHPNNCFQMMRRPEYTNNCCVETRLGMQTCAINNANSSGSISTNTNDWH